MTNKPLEDQFEDYIAKLREEFQENPKRALREAHLLLGRLSTPKKQILDADSKKILLIVLYFIIIALIGLINYTSILLYIGGLVFFAIGLLNGLNINRFGIVFLFSHGMSGLGLMLASELSGLLTSPFISDAPLYIYILLGMVLVLVILGLITTILYNLSDKFKNNEFSISIPFTLFGMAIVLAIIISKLVLIKYGIHAAISLF